MFQVAVRQEQGAWCSATDFSLQKNGRASCPSVFGPGVSNLECFCAIQVPYEHPHVADTTRAWVLVYSSPVFPNDEPMHAEDLPFPFHLPLYPQKPLLFVAMRAVTGKTHLPFTLAWPCIQPTVRYALSHHLFLASMDEWQKATRTKPTRAFLSDSFDRFWVLEPGHETTLPADAYLDEEPQEQFVMSNVHDGASVTSKNNATEITRNTEVSELPTDSSDESGEDDTESSDDSSTDDDFHANQAECDEEFEYPDVDDDESEQESTSSSDEGVDGPEDV